jgi:phosphonoacetate hydrolase
MLDGFGVDYYRGAKMPTLNAIERNGIYREVHSLMPSVTNLNNVAICTGNFPSVNGITGNSYFKTVTNTEEFMEDPQLIMAPTIFQKAKKLGIESIIFASKKKTIGLLYKDTKDTVSPETASSYWINRVGRPAPSIYSREVNYWLMDAALYSIQHDTNVNLFYIHPTDYPMHTWSAESEEATTYLNTMDGYIKKIIELVPNATVLLTADHTVSHKSLCWDLNKACLNRNTPIKIAISPERDKYFIHHRGFGGTAYVYLNNPNDLLSVKNILAHLKGVDEVLTRDEAAKRFHLMADRIGDLVVLGDQTTVFGDLDAESEVLPATYRSHGSTYDTSVPLFIHNGKNVPPAATFQYNFQITPWLFRQ